VRQHRFDDAVGAAPVLGDLVGLPVSIAMVSSISARASPSSEPEGRRRDLLQSPNSSFDSVRNC